MENQKKEKQNKDFIHFCYTPFTGLGLHSGYRGDDWFKYRIEIFKKYTLKSLLNQTNRDFIHWISFRPQERENPLTHELHDYMRQLKDYNFIFTFGGLCFWDDKYKNDNLLERLEITMPALRGVWRGERLIYETLAPSDDLYHGKEIGYIQEMKATPDTALTHKKGFLLSDETQRLAEWNPITNPPFYTLIYPADVFFNPKKHFDYMKGFKSHEDIPRMFDCVEMPDRRYCVLVHKKNISTNWWHPFRGKVFSWKKGKEILQDFGIKVEEPSSISAGLREGKMIMRHYLLKILIKLGAYKLAWKIRQKIRPGIKTGKR